MGKARAPEPLNKRLEPLGTSALDASKGQREELLFLAALGYASAIRSVP